MIWNWKKLGKIFDPRMVQDRPWLKEYAQAPCVLMFENFIRVYFSCRPLPEENKMYKSYSAYLDLNRKDLFEIIGVANRPVLTLGEEGTFDEFGTYPISVIREENKIIAYYAGWTRCESVPFNVAIGAGISTDGGKSFVKCGVGPVLSYSLNEPFVISGPKVRKFNDRWYLFYIAGTKWIANGTRPEPVYKIRIAISDNGFDWKIKGSNIIESKLGEDEAQASPDVIFLGDRYHMFFSYRYSLNFRGKERGYRIGYAYSHDLETWTRDDSQVGIDISEEGWDSEMISYPHVFELDGKVYMLYLGNDVGKFGFGLAELNTKSGS